MNKTSKTVKLYPERFQSQKVQNIVLLRFQNMFYGASMGLNYIFCLKVCFMLTNCFRVRNIVLK